ncbi:hypothetical protein P691DRAFT_786062, partial [Macrolepiota fuliginosa MF-IS2]
LGLELALTGLGVHSNRDVWGKGIGGAGFSTPSKPHFPNELDRDLGECMVQQVVVVVGGRLRSYCWRGVWQWWFWNHGYSSMGLIANLLEVKFEMVFIGHGVVESEGELGYAPGGLKNSMAAAIVSSERMLGSYSKRVTSWVRLYGILDHGSICEAPRSGLQLKGRWQRFNKRGDCICQEKLSDGTIFSPK